MAKRGSYLGGSTLVGPRSGWFSKPLSLEDRAKQVAEGAARELQERMQAERAAGGSELQRILDRQAEALVKRAERSTPVAVEERRLHKLERAKMRVETKEIRRRDRFASDYPNVGTDIDAAFKKV